MLGHLNGRAPSVTEGVLSTSTFQLSEGLPRTFKNRLSIQLFANVRGRPPIPSQDKRLSPKTAIFWRLSLAVIPKSAMVGGGGGD